jgi:hypothetical protein
MTTFFSKYSQKNNQFHSQYSSTIYVYLYQFPWKKKNWLHVSAILVGSFHQFAIRSGEMSIKERNFFFTIEPMKTEHKNL